jgi:hypothetical protein
MESANKNSIYTLTSTMTVTKPIFTKLLLQLLCKVVCTEFDENPTNGLVVYTGSQANRQADRQT